MPTAPLAPRWLPRPRVPVATAPTATWSLERTAADHELDDARSVQRSWLPSSSSRVGPFEIASVTMAARALSGDFHDWRCPAPGLLTLAIGDAMGKGTSAALIAATVRAALRAVARSSPPAEAMRYLAPAVSDDLARANSLVTLFIAQIDVGRGTMRFVDAGHGHALVLRASGAVTPLATGGLPLGVCDEATYAEREVTLFAGDTVITFTDGLVAASPDPLDAGLRTAADLARGPGDAERIAARIASVAHPRRTRPLDDDLTVLVLRHVG
jgi:sigma-B regulation protein RsbU (phosphoserine phosphatase)